MKEAQPLMGEQGMLLPNDVIIDIIKFLDIENFLSFASVSKSHYLFFKKYKKEIIWPILDMRIKKFEDNYSDLIKESDYSYNIASYTNDSCSGKIALGLAATSFFSTAIFGLFFINYLWEKSKSYSKDAINQGLEVELITGSLALISCLVCVCAITVRNLKLCRDAEISVNNIEKIEENKKLINTVIVEEVSEKDEGNNEKYVGAPGYGSIQR